MRIVTVIDKIERVLIFALFAVMVLAVFSQVVNRNIFKLEIGWFEEVARACMVYIILFAAEIGLRDHSQLNIDSLVRRLPPKVAGVLENISTVVTIIFSGMVGFTSIQLLQTQAAAQSVTPGVGMPTWVPQASITTGCILIFITQCIILLNTILHHKKEEGESA
ncbi:TRAP transporter small permease subunit [Anaerotruncus colihominis]|uniref:TRAP transporter small permease subunit n=1 Tax=Anaerotruncus colihominis TaxID=169435 RepID=UPI0018984FAD